VLDNLMSADGFSARDGWAKRIWSRAMTWTSKGKEGTIEQGRSYLAHADGRVITVHRRAWMGGADMAMWADVQMRPWAADSGRKKLIVWDNCGPHGVPAVTAALAAHDIATKALPPRMTSRLQVMGLVVNGPLKAAMRRARATALFSSLQNWKFLRAMEQAKPVEERVVLPYVPPKPALPDGLRAPVGTRSRRPTSRQGYGARSCARGLAPNAEGCHEQYAGHPSSAVRAPSSWRRSRSAATGCTRATR
jgi:hypothetical protein